MYHGVCVCMYVCMYICMYAYSYILMLERFPKLEAVLVHPLAVFVYEYINMYVSAS